MAHPKKITDDLGFELLLGKTPKRIISLVPSLTELLVDLGLEKQLVGTTRFCIYPKHLRKEKVQVGGTKQVNYNKIKALKPDFILCNKEENTEEMVLQLRQIAPVFVSDINSIQDVLRLIKSLGEILDCKEQALVINKEIAQKKADFIQFIKNKKPKKVAYFIWKEPWMVAGENTFINTLLAMNKFENVIQNKGHYPQIKLREIANSELLLLSSEPYPFKDNDRKTVEAQTGIQTILVSGEYFSWYGSRLIKAFDYFKELHQRI